jgi:prevent-host-death family protein
MEVSVAEAKNKLTQLISAVERGEEVTISRRGKPVVQLVRVKRAPKFGTLREKYPDRFPLSPEEFHELTRPMTDEEVDAFLEGRY